LISNAFAAAGWLFTRKIQQFKPVKLLGIDPGSIDENGVVANV